MYRGNVLCVSSDFRVSESWRQHLSGAGFHVVAAADPGEAFDSLAPERFDVLLLRDDFGLTNREVLIKHARRCRTQVLVVGCGDAALSEDADWIATDRGAETIVAAVERRMQRMTVAAR